MIGRDLERAIVYFIASFGCLAVAIGMPFWAVEPALQFAALFLLLPSAGILAGMGWSRWRRYRRIQNQFTTDPVQDNQANQLVLVGSRKLKCVAADGSENSFADSVKNWLMHWHAHDVGPAVEEQLPELAARLMAGVDKQGHASEQMHLQSANPGTVTIDISCSAIMDAPDRYRWELRDVSAAVATAQRADAHRQALEAVLSHVSLGLLQVTAEGKPGFMNAQLRQWLGLPVADTASNGAAGEDSRYNVSVVAEPAMSGVDDTGQSNGIFSRKIALKAANGETVELLAETGNGLDTAHCRHYVLLPPACEIAPARQSELYRQQVDQLFENAPVAMITLKDGDTIYRVNQAALHIFDNANIAGQPLWSVLDAGELARVKTFLHAPPEDKAGLQQAEFELAKIYGGRRVQIYRSNLPATGNGTASNQSDDELVLHLVDTTEHHDLELKFAQSQKMQAIGQLAGGVAHDFNNLLTVIIGNTDLLLQRVRAGDEYFPDIMQVQQNAHRAANLVRQLLAFSRQQTLQPKVLSITDVLAEVSHLIRRVIGESLELEIEHGRDLGLVKVDQTQFEQVIINLAVNARDAMEDGGKLKIRTRNVSYEESQNLGHELMEPGEYVLIEVEDTGKGIAKEDLGRIFEPFFTTKQPGTGTGSGTGLGLSTVFGIVKQTGGYIYPESELGEGTCFRIYFPCHQVAAISSDGQGAEAAFSPPQDLTGKGRILLVEDEEAVRSFAHRALQNKGYTVFEADSGEAALAILDSHEDSIDLVISDVVMPQMDGPTLVKAIRKRRPEIKVIYISGYAEDAFRRNVDPDSAFHLLPKPFSLKQLASKVKEVIDPAPPGV